MVTIKGSYVGNRKDTSEALEFFRRGVIKAPFKTVGLSELQKVYDLMHEGKIAGRVSTGKLPKHCLDTLLTLRLAVRVGH